MSVCGTETLAEDLGDRELRRYACALLRWRNRESDTETRIPHPGDNSAESAGVPMQCYSTGEDAGAP